MSGFLIVYSPSVLSYKEKELSEENKRERVVVSVANNYMEDSSSVFDSDALFSNIDKALEIAERSAVVDYTDIQITTRVDADAGYRIITEVSVGGLIFGDISEEPTDVPIYDVEWTEFPIELQQKISDGLVLLMINSWLEEAGLNPVEYDTPDEDISLEQKRCIILGIVSNYCDEGEKAPDEMNELDINETLKSFGFNFNWKGDINGD